jgi:hypothetical protein
MLKLELQGMAYNKTVHRNRLMGFLNSRSHGSIERKHQNISAILIELGYPYISGYKPLSNYQTLLAQVVTDRISGNTDLIGTVAEAVDQPADPLPVSDWQSCLDDPPMVDQNALQMVSNKKPPVYGGLKVNYLEREARNSSLGLAGEKFVLNFERDRLNHLGKPSLAKKIEHVSESKGDGLGFDILSFDSDGKERLIEVKTTAYGKETPFFISHNEVEVSKEKQELFYLYRVFKFRSAPRLFMLDGAVDKRFRLKPMLYQAGFYF